MMVRLSNETRIGSIEDSHRLHLNSGIAGQRETGKAKCGSLGIFNPLSNLHSDHDISIEMQMMDAERRSRPPTVPLSFVVFARIYTRKIMNILRSQEEFSVKVLASAASDEVLVEMAKLRDHPAFAELWNRHSNTAFKVAYRITGRREDAEDVIQDAWMKAYVHLNTFDGRAKFSTWLTRIAINSSLMILRRRRARAETSMEVTDGDTWQHWEIADQTKNVEELYARHERVEHLRRAICRLQPTLRTVVEIHQSNDRSLKEVAELAGISVAATKSRLLRARKLLRESLCPEESMTL
jgi:RNA polymerase sigma-70 factor (ECF subfamily)